MPYVNIRTNKTVDAALAEAMQGEIGELIAIIPGKTIDNCMTQFTGGAPIYMGGKALDGAYAEIRLFGPSPAEAKGEFTEKLTALLERALGAKHVYINFVESREWGSGGRYMGG